MTALTDTYWVFLLWVNKFMRCVFMGEKKLILIMFGVFRGELTFFAFCIIFSPFCAMFCVFMGGLNPLTRGALHQKEKHLMLEWTLCTSANILSLMNTKKKEKTQKRNTLKHKEKRKKIHKDI